MELGLSSGWVGDVFVNLIASAIWAGAGVLVIALFTQYWFHRFRYIIFYHYWGRTILLILLGSTGSLILVTIWNGVPNLPRQLSYALLFLCIFQFLVLYRYAKYGLFAVQRTVASGTSYQDALSLCKRSISFLGTGAAKLTSQPNFEDTVRRCCTQGGSVRFLLSSPSNEILEKSAANAGIALDSYVVNVKKSLQKLRELKVDRRFDIEVRFYNKLDATSIQFFRLFFIDDVDVLVSFNRYGSQDGGAESSQLVLSRRAPSAPDMSQYAAFENYFTRLWETADRWDFQDHI